MPTALRDSGSRFACISGGAAQVRSRVLDWIAGIEYGAHEFSGCYGLAATREDRFIVGVRPAGLPYGTPGLAVFDGESFAPLYVRVEGGEGASAEIVPASD